MTNFEQEMKNTINIFGSKKDKEDEIIEQPNILYLYNEGDECKKITGGWQIEGYTLQNQNDWGGIKEVLKRDKYMEVDLSTTLLWIIGTNNEIDVSNYNKLYVWGDQINDRGSATTTLYYGNTKTISGNYTSFENKTGKITDNYIFECSIKDLKGSYYFAFLDGCEKGYNRNIIIKKIWIEK